MKKKPPKLSVAEKTALAVQEALAEVRQITPRTTADLAFDIAELIVAVKRDRKDDAATYLNSIAATLKSASAPGFETAAFTLTILDVVKTRFEEIKNRKPPATLITETVSQYCSRGGIVTKVLPNKPSSSTLVQAQTLSLDDLGL